MQRSLSLHNEFVRFTDVISENAKPFKGLGVENIILKRFLFCNIFLYKRKKK